MKVQNIDKNDMNLYIDSDYCFVRMPPFKFYYGYEQYFCPNAHQSVDDCNQSDCYAGGWAFVASVNDIEIYRSNLGLHFGDGETETTAEYLLRGLLELIQKGVFNYENTRTNQTS